MTDLKENVTIHECWMSVFHDDPIGLWVAEPGLTTFVTCSLYFPSNNLVVLSVMATIPRRVAAVDWPNQNLVYRRLMPQAAFGSWDTAVVQLAG